MKRFFVYFRLQLKRYSRTYPAVLMVSLLLFAGLASLAVMFIGQNSSSDSKSRIPVGVVGDFESNSLGVGLKALQAMDSTKYSLELVELDSEEKAIQRLNAGEITCYVLVPENFVHSIMSGDNIPLRFVMPKSTASIGTLLIGDVAKSVSAVITSTQNGIYAASDYAEDIGRYSAYRKKWQELELGYVDLVLSRSNITATEIIGVGDRLDFSSYYFCGILVLFIMLFGISCSHTLSVQNTSLLRLLNSRGTKTTAVVLAEYLAYFVTAQLTVTVIVAVLCAVTGYVGIDIPVLGGADFFSGIWLSLLLVPVVAMLASLQYLLSQLAADIVSGILLQFAVFVGMGYISGCFYPDYFFPEVVQRLSSVLPSGIAFDYAAGVLSSGVAAVLIVGCAGYVLAFLALSVLVKRIRR